MRSLPIRFLPDPEVIFIDASIVVVNKPSGMLSVPGRSPEKADCVLSRLEALNLAPYVVHRLDMETSGVMIFARDPDAQRALNKQFMARIVQKTYQAIVADHVKKNDFVVEEPLITDWPNRPRQKIDPINGKAAQTHVHVMAQQGENTRVRLTPITGRSHQLRVHMMSVGHPILGDSLYAPDPIFKRAERLLLHAEKLTIVHPETGQTKTFETTVPF